MVNCPKCGREMRYIEQYDRWYCDYCKEYAPAGYAGRPAPVAESRQPVEPAAPLCSKCGGPLTYIKEYDRWYCYACKEYAPKGIPAPQAAVKQSPAPAKQTRPVAQVAAPAAAVATPSAPVTQPAPRPVARPSVQRGPSHSHAGNPATGGWVMLLGFLLVLTDEMMYILFRTGAISNLNPPIIGGGGMTGGLLLYGGGVGSLVGIMGLLIFMVGGVMAALAAKVK